MKSPKIWNSRKFKHAKFTNSTVIKFFTHLLSKYDLRDWAYNFLASSHKQPFSTIAAQKAYGNNNFGWIAVIYDSMIF